MKNTARIISFLLAAILLIPTNAYAAETDTAKYANHGIMYSASQVAVEVEESDAPASIGAAPNWDNLDSIDDYIEYMQSNNCTFVSEAASISVEELLEDIPMTCANADGSINRSFESTHVKTGTPDIYWYFTADIVIAPYKNGTGYYIKEVSNVIVHIEKNGACIFGQILSILLLQTLHTQLLHIRIRRALP